jgi:hypothetical protein
VALLAATGSEQRKQGAEWRQERFLVVTCRDEGDQVELLHRFHAERLDCRAPVS